MKTIYLEDNYYPDVGFDNTRKVVRAILLNENNEIALIKLHGFDSFGYRNYYETPGGGIKKFESKKKALRREILEEVGVEIKEIKSLIRIVDFYNMIQRRNDNYFYLCKVKSYKEAHLEDYEKKIMKGVFWFKIEDAIDAYENSYPSPVALLVKQRELIVLNLVKDILNIL